MKRSLAGWTGLLAGALLLPAGAVVLFGQGEGDVTQADINIAGPKHTLHFRSVESRAKGSLAKYDEKRRSHKQSIDHAQKESESRLAGLPPPPPPGKIIRVPYQTLTYAIKDPSNRPVVGLHLTASYTTKKGDTREIKDCVTDELGKIKLAKIGPLPVSLKLDIAAEDAPAWHPSDATLAGVTIEKGDGRALPGTPTRIAWRTASMTTIIPASYEPQQQQKKKSQKGQKPQAQKPPASKSFDVEYVADDREMKVERDAVDVLVTTQPGAEVSWPAKPEAAWKAGPKGIAVCRMPLEAFDRDQTIPLCVTAHLPGGDAEAVVRDYEYKGDPYTAISVTAPPLELITLKPDAFKLGTNARVSAPFDGSGGQQEADGSKTITQNGLQLSVRQTARNKNQWYVDRIRLTGAGGGSIGNVKVGSSRKEVEENLGPPQIHGDHWTAGSQLPGEVDTYLDRGLRIAYSGGQVSAIEVARPEGLLTGGTTAFVSRPRARLFVESYSGSGMPDLNSTQDLRRMLGGLHAIELVDTREKADLRLTARASGHEQAGSNRKMIAGCPFAFSWTTELSYTLKDADNHAVIENRVIESSAGVDYSTDTAGRSGKVYAFLADQRNANALNSGKSVNGDKLDTLELVELQATMRRAVTRCPAVSARTVFSQMLSDIAREADYTVRIMDIDYGKGTIRLNVGRAQGVQESTSAHPYEFQLLVSGQPLPSWEAGLSANYYTAVVTQVDENSCECQLRHIVRTVENGHEVFDEDPDLEMAARLPDPASGAVAARAWFPYPTVNVGAVLPADLIPTITPGEGTRLERALYSDKPVRNRPTAFQAFISRASSVISRDDFSGNRPIFVQSVTRVIPPAQPGSPRVRPPWVPAYVIENRHNMDQRIVEINKDYTKRHASAVVVLNNGGKVPGGGQPGGGQPGGGQPGGGQPGGGQPGGGRPGGGQPGGGQPGGGRPGGGQPGGGQPGGGQPGGGQPGGGQPGGGQPGGGRPGGGQPGGGQPGGGRQPGGGQPGGGQPGGGRQPGGGQPTGGQPGGGRQPGGGSPGRAVDPPSRRNETPPPAKKEDPKKKP